MSRRPPGWLSRGVFFRGPSRGQRLGPPQRSFAFVERYERLARRFKITILAVTCVAVGVLFFSSSNLRNAASWLTTRTRWTVLGAVGQSPGRKDVEDDWRRRRLHDIEQTRGKLRSVYAEYPDAMRRLLDHAGLDPDHALLRWGNFDRTLYLPSTVFEPDDTGRSYRFRPGTRSIWVRNLKLKGGILAYFPIPLTARLDDIVQGTGALVVAPSVQTTNAWGLRGPEPDTKATVRGIILGDSYMQGLFVGDDETPSECLKQELARGRKESVEILNTGHLGYSPEQEYYTLLAFADRFNPQFVVLSLFANDFGDLFEVLEGKGDWDEGRYWISQITGFCRAREIVCLVVPAPWVNQVEGPRRSGFYPGMISNILDAESSGYLDPIEDFAAETLRLKLRSQRDRKAASGNPLFNGHLGDGHFSPLGCVVWAKAVAPRLALLLESRKGPLPQSLRASGSSPD